MMPETFDSPPWWGYSKDHGWVVLDRSIPVNKSGLPMDFLFCRCSDSATFTDRRSRWGAPHYIYASTYIGSLPEPEQAKAEEEYQQFKARWVEFQMEINRQYGEREARRLQEEHERVLLEGSRRVVKVKR